MRKLLYGFMIVVVLCGLGGCASKDKDEARPTSSDIKEIKLACAQMCKEMESPPFDEKLITAEDDIEAFANAMNNAEKMAGVLDYGVIFNMAITYENGSEERYVLNIDNDENSVGLLVNLNDSGQGYTISEQATRMLRTIIYGK
ncbi:hypothetical protein [Paenibacillus silvisoli]|uniref:hypothetical protein n=1 Tax=Paenibacillus silvisoli TaxID=3110539 RepID=UPI002804E736|nr:hypothetical protein [Paenibacillus silvisoli]